MAECVLRLVKLFTEGPLSGSRLACSTTLAAAILFAYGRLIASGYGAVPL